MRKIFAALIILATLIPVSRAAPAEEPVRVYAAASLTDALTDVAERWRLQGHPQPVLVFAASSLLAKQIEAGAPADLFASADLTWMEYLQTRGKIAPATQVRLLGNSLVMIAPRGRAFAVRMDSGFDAAGAFEGKLCTGEPASVPVGKYAKEALTSLGWWAALEKRIVGTDDVRATLAFVERGECAAGIVYATDAAISDKVEVVGRFPESTHAPIVYPFAPLVGAQPQARAFLEYLRSAPESAQVFTTRGFTLLPH